MIGQTILHYRIIEKLGAAGWAWYSKPRTPNSIALCVEVFARRSGQRCSALGRFRREAKAASALNHPNICTIHEINEQVGQTFL